MTVQLAGIKTLDTITARMLSGGMRITGEEGERCRRFLWVLVAVIGAINLKDYGKNEYLYDIGNL